MLRFVIHFIICLFSLWIDGDKCILTVNFVYMNCFLKKERKGEEGEMEGRKRERESSV